MSSSSKLDLDYATFLQQRENKLNEEQYRSNVKMLKKTTALDIFLQVHQKKLSTATKSVGMISRQQVLLDDSDNAPYTVGEIKELFNKILELHHDVLNERGVDKTPVDTPISTPREEVKEKEKEKKKKVIVKKKIEEGDETKPTPKRKREEDDEEDEEGDEVMKKRLKLLEYSPTVPTSSSLVCKCMKSGCDTRRCACYKNEKGCNTFCKCGDNCENPM